MPVNYALYNALRSAPDRGARERGAQQSMGYLSQLNQMLERQQTQRLQDEEKVNERLQQFSNIEGLERDKTDLLKLVKREEKKILKGIRDAGGNTSRYINTGGLGQLRGYYDNIRNSEQMQKTINNYKTDQKYQEAIDKGMLAIPTMMKLGPDGKPHDDGKKQFVTYAQQKQMYEDGDLEEITWTGAQKPIILDPLKFRKIPNPDDPLKDRFVRVDEAMKYMQMLGQDPGLAYMLAEKMRVGDSNFTQLRFGKDPTAVQMQMLKTKLGLTKEAKEQQMMAKLFKSQERVRNYTDFVTGKYSKDRPGDVVYYDPENKEQKIDTEYAGLEGGKAYEKQERWLAHPLQIREVEKVLKPSMGIHYDKSKSPAENKLAINDFVLKQGGYKILSNSGQMLNMNIGDEGKKEAMNILGKPEMYHIRKTSFRKGEEQEISPEATMKQSDISTFYRIPVALDEDQVESMGFHEEGWEGGFFGMFGEDIKGDLETTIEETEGSEEKYGDYKTYIYVELPLDPTSTEFFGEKLDLPETVGTQYPFNVDQAYWLNQQNQQNPYMTAQVMQEMQYLSDQMNYDMTDTSEYLNQ